MKVRFKAAALGRLEEEEHDGGYPSGVARGFRKRMQIIRAAPDERVLRNWKSLHFERLKGRRSHQHSIRLNAQWRLVIEFEGGSPDKVVVVVGVEDYH